MSREIPGNAHRQFTHPHRLAPLFNFGPPGSTFYLNPMGTTLTVEGITYLPAAIKLQDIRSNSDGKIEPATLIISNVEGLLKEPLRTTRPDNWPLLFRVYDYDDDNVIFEEQLKVLRVTEITDEAVGIELGSFNTFMQELLKDKFIDVCQWRYKQPGCWVIKSDGTGIQPSWFVVGSPDSCDYSDADCRRHGNTLRRKAMPGIPQGGSI